MPSTRRRFLLSAAAATPVLATAQRPVPQALAGAPACTDVTLPAPILALRDRRPDFRPISVHERAERHDRAREVMAQFHIDAILLTTGSSLLYFTGGRWGQSERLFAYVLPQKAAPFVVCPAMERDRLAEQLVNFPERDTTLTYLWQEHENPFSTLRRGLAEINITAGSLAIEEHVQFAFSYAIAEACPALKIATAKPVTAGCRAIKSPAEIGCLRLANGITLDVYRAVFQSAHPGMNNHEITDLIDKAYARCGVRGDASCNVGPNSAIPHGSAKPQVIHEGEIVMIDDGCTVDGYTADITRTFVYGTPNDEQRRVFDIVHRAQAAALAAAVPGAEMQSVDAAARKVITDAGFGPGYDHFYHRLGHGIGLDGHEWPYLVGGNTATLQPTMTFSDEPGVYQQGKFGIRLEDCMVITPDGAQLFTPASPSLEKPFG